MVCSCPETLKSWALNSTYSCTVKSCDQAWSKQMLLDRIVLVSVGSVKQTPCWSQYVDPGSCYFSHERSLKQTQAPSVGWWWRFSLLLSNPRRFVSSAMVFLVHFVNLVLFDFKILLTVPLMSLDHVWIVTNARNCWYHASAPVGMTVIVSVEGGFVSLGWHH